MKNKKLLFFILLCTALISTLLFGCNKLNPVYLDADSSSFLDFEVIDEKVYISCYIVLINTSKNDFKVTMQGDFLSDVDGGLLTNASLTAVSEDMSTTEFTVAPGKNQYKIYFVDDFAGTMIKNDRLLPKIELSIIN